MTELKAQASRAPHVVGGAPSPTQAGSPLLGRPDAGPFQAGRTSDASPGSLGGLLFPRPCQGPDPDPDGKAPGQQPALSDVEGVYPRVEAAGGAGGGRSRAPEKDSGLLDRVLDTLLAPAGPGQSHASPAAYEAGSPWCLFGPELPEGPAAVPAAQGALPSLLMSRPEGKAGDGSSGKALPRGLSPSRPLLPSAPGSQHWPGAAGKPAPPPAALEVPEGGAESAGSAGPLLKGSRSRAPGGTAPGAAEGGGALVPKEDSRFSAPRVALAEPDPPAGPGRPPVTAMVMDFIHLPILPISPALLAARTRQLLEGDSSDGGAAAGASAFAPPRGSPLASSPPGAAGDFPDCAYPPEPKDDAFPLYGDFQPPALKIKEEEEGAEAAARSPRAYLVAGASPAVFPDFQLPQPPLPPRAPSSRPGEATGPAAAPASAAASASAASPSPSGSALECMLYKAEAAPPLQGPFAPQPCKPPGAGPCALPRDGLPAAAASSSVCAAAGPGPALYPPLGINGIPPLGYPAAVLKEGLAPVYPPYLNYLR